MWLTLCPCSDSASLIPKNGRALNYVWSVPYWFGPRVATDGWTFSGRIFARSGLPFTVVDGNATGTLSAFNYGGNLNGAGAFVFANSNGGTRPACGFSAITTPCLTSTMFTPVPHWESAKFGVGVQFFNLFNHPNFDQPSADIASPTFGTITSTVNTPTSILGSFLGGDASPRQIQFKGSLTF